jgi:hypothetical protein
MPYCGIIIKKKTQDRSLDISKKPNKNNAIQDNPKEEEFLNLGNNVHHFLVQ